MPPFKYKTASILTALLLRFSSINALLWQTRTSTLSPFYFLPDEPTATETMAANTTLEDQESLASVDISRELGAFLASKSSTFACGGSILIVRCLHVSSLVCGSQPSICY